LREVKEAVIRTSGLPLEAAYQVENECARDVMRSEDAKGRATRVYREA